MKPVRFVQRLLAGRLPGGSRHCVICGHHVWRFLPYRGGARAALMRALDTIGSDVRNFECPCCRAHDRERHLFLYLQATRLLENMRGKNILHIAPERHLRERIAEMGPANYVRGDLHAKGENIRRVDILDMEFESETFDVFIANHVLEHVEDDLRALSEIRRALKKGGCAILQTPYSPKLEKTWQDAGINDANARFQAYGQEDHVRLYGRDIFERIASSGLVSEVHTHAQLLPDIDSRRVGVNPREPFFLFRRSD